MKYICFSCAYLHTNVAMVTGLMLDVDNLRAVKNVPLSERWATLQSDFLLYIDDDKSAAMLGTGLDEWVGGYVKMVVILNRENIELISMKLNTAAKAMLPCV